MMKWYARPVLHSLDHVIVGVRDLESATKFEGLARLMVDGDMALLEGKPLHEVDPR